MAYALCLPSSLPTTHRQPMTVLFAFLLALGSLLFGTAPPEAGATTSTAVRNAALKNIAVATVTLRLRVEVEALDEPRSRSNEKRILRRTQEALARRFSDAEITDAEWVSLEGEPEAPITRRGVPEAAADRSTGSNGSPPPA